VDVIPKRVSRSLLEPAMRLPQPVRLICREDTADRLLADLSARRLKMVLSDGPIGTAVEFEGFNHLLGECGVCFLAMESLRSAMPRDESFSSQCGDNEVWMPMHLLRLSYYFAYNSNFGSSDPGRSVPCRSRSPTWRSA
jgi:hypothetical protein